MADFQTKNFLNFGKKRVHCGVKNVVGTLMQNKYVKLEADSFKIGGEIPSTSLKNVILT